MAKRRWGKLDCGLVSERILGMDKRATQEFGWGLLIVCHWSCSVVARNVSGFGCYNSCDVIHSLFVLVDLLLALNFFPKALLVSTCLDVFLNGHVQCGSGFNSRLLDLFSVHHLVARSWNCCGWTKK